MVRYAWWHSTIHVSNTSTTPPAASSLLEMASSPPQVFFKTKMVITIQRERYVVGEALFQPSILGLEEYGVVEQLVRSISCVSSENHRQLMENIVLCGGTASMPVKILYDPVQPPEYMPENLSKNSAWMGGAILAKVVFPQNQHITKGDYDETGPAIACQRLTRALSHYLGGHSPRIGGLCDQLQALVEAYQGLLEWHIAQEHAVGTQLLKI
ncbi:hypothetical protein Taro_035716 [Colocasia esculenta]|uniref:Uncharacterized protein n=1 Tax=Colocasia esculenta TaxID=4460 RepID=A0A843WE22_COLES|nr:hypothetical protein [Colocasia esculenta]